MTTIATLLSGGEGVGLGARAAGLDHLWGIEIDDGIASCARENGFNVIAADLMHIDPRNLVSPDVLHASPECKSASTANHTRKKGKRETVLDFEIGVRITSFIDVLLPRVFTLENVWLYRTYDAFECIVEALERNGYTYDFQHLNAADFAVPQSRKRLILRARRGGGLPDLPEPQKWRGWYDAVEDLLGDLREVELANWQKERLENMPDKTSLFSQGISRDHAGREYPLLTRGAHQPAYTVTANRNMNSMRACLVGGQFDRPSSEPDRLPQLRGDGEPSPTVTASYKGDWRAVLIDGQNAGRDRITTRLDAEPAFTVTNPAKAYPRAIIDSGRIVMLDNHCMARFQTFPDWYKLPDRRTLASRVIGNAVPPLLYQKIVSQLV